MKTQQEIKAWVLSRVEFFKTKLEKAESSYDIESEMYAMMRMLEAGFQKSHELNKGVVKLVRP